MKSYKILYLFLFFAIILAAVLLVKNITVANRIETERASLPLIETNPTDIPIDPLDPMFGNQGAALTIVEFADLNSEESRVAHGKIKKFITENPTKARLIWKNFPVSSIFYKNENLPHQAAYCISKQDNNEFWKYIDDVINAGNSMRQEKTLADLAEKTSVNLGVWKNCIRSAEATSRIESEISLAQSLGLKRAPIIFINNKKVNYLDEINLDDLLAEVIKP